MDKLKPTYQFDQLQAWLVLSKFIDMNTHLPRTMDIPEIVRNAINALNHSINPGLEGEQDFDEESNPIGEPEIVTTLIECQDEKWNEELNEAMKALDEALPLWIKREIRIVNFCQSKYDNLDSEYQCIAEDGMGIKRRNYEKDWEEKFQATFKVKNGMDRDDVQNRIAEMFCPPGYNFHSRSLSFHFCKDSKDIVYTFSYSRNGADLYQQAIGW